MVSAAGRPERSVAKRRSFGLDTPLPADPRMVQRAILRHLAESRPAITPVPLGKVPRATAAVKAPIDAGLPDLMLLAPGGRVTFVKIKTQAEDLSRAHQAFADLCRACAIPVLVVRSLLEAKRGFDRLGL